MLKLKRWLWLAVAVPLLLAGQALASSEQISSYDSRAVVGADGGVTVTETITYDFGGNYKHGIYRYLPLQTQDSAGSTYASDPRVNSVQMDGADEQYTDYDQGNDYIIKIGDPNHTITGSHVYSIVYTLPSFAIKGDQGDIVRFNVTGNGWQVPIAHVTSTIAAPVAATKATCYTGPAGSTAKNCQANSVATAMEPLRCPANADCAVPGGEATFTADNLNAGDGLTDEALYPSGTFSAYLTPGTSPRANKSGSGASDNLGLGTIIGLIGSALIFLAACALWAGRRFMEWKRKHSQTVIAEYEAPDGLRPAELGLLIDDTASMTEITATMIDLAVRKHLKITLVRAKSLFKSAEYRFDRLESTDPLEDYEQALMNAIFPNGLSTMLLSEINRTNMAAAITGIKSTLTDRLTAKGYYAAESKALKIADDANPAPRATKSAAKTWLTVVSIIVAVILIIIGGRLVLYLGVFAEVIFLAAMRADRLTAAGVSEWAKVDGFKLFLSVTEKDRLKFTDAPERTPELFSKMLPAAIALGVEQQWAGQFANMDVTPAVGYWYYGPYASYNSLWIASEMSQSFSPAIATGFVPQQSSSGSFGGGFSGGGGGGGGGGSW